MTNWITNIQSSSGKEKKNSGFVANNDMSYFANQIGFKNLDYERYDNPNYSEEEINQIVNELLAPIKAEDTLFIQFPTWQRLNIEQAFFKEVFKRKIPTVLIIWDVLPWLHDGSERDFTREYAFKIMNACDLLVIPNEKMGRRLATEAKVQTPMVSIDLWDYRIKEPALTLPKFSEKLFFVGTLDKTDFLNYNGQAPIHLIGNPVGLTEAERHKENLIVMGEVANDEIPGLLDGGFCLVSYQGGNTKNRFKGAEKYGQYNNPLKLSLYLASGLPVIVDSRSAHASLIRSENLGVVLDDLNDVPLVFASLSEAEYREISLNVQRYAQLIRAGHFTQYALSKAAEKMDAAKF